MRTPSSLRAIRNVALAALVTCALGPGTAPADDDICGITPQSAENIAREIMRQAGHAFDSTSRAYYVSVMASRLAPYYVVYFMQKGFVVGEIEVDICGRQDTPHPGVQYAAASDLRADSLLLEPDVAFARFKVLTGADAVFGSRIFPYGLTPAVSGWAGADFWWMILDDDARWHYMSKLGEVIKLERRAKPAFPKAGPKAPEKP
jgi:hypothetical protein